MIDQMCGAEEANWQRASVYSNCLSDACRPAARCTFGSNEYSLQLFAVQNEHNGTGPRNCCQVSIQSVCLSGI